MTALFFDGLLDLARAREEVVGMYVFGSSLRYGTRLDAVEAIPHALRTIFALAGRVRPYNKYLEWELRHPSLEGWAADDLLPLLDRVLTGEQAAQHELFNRIEPVARREGFGDVVDGWEPDVDWLRGDAGYREP